MARPRGNAATPNDGSSSTTTATAGAARAKKLKPKRKREECLGSSRTTQTQRSSAFRGVTRHRWTGRFEAHLWDKDTWNHESRARKKKGKQVYLGAYDDEEAAARAHDLAALKYWGPGTVLNFPLCSYDEELREMEGQSREEYIGSVRRRSSGFSRGVSKYRGVARHHHNGRWEARIGRVLGNKYLYLGTYATQEEAAVAYDVAAIEHRGLNAVTNFDISHYVTWHRRRRLAEDGFHAADLPNDLCLDDTVATDDDDFRDGEHHHPYRVADSFIVQQLPDDQLDQVITRAPVPAPTSSSALDLLLRSPKFMEMMEQASAAAAAESSTGSPSPCASSSPSSPALSQPSPEPQQESSGGASSSAPPCSFVVPADDVRTFFDCESFAFAEVDTFLFGDLGSYAAPMFQCDVDLFV